jgi:hypothetical protein
MPLKLSELIQKAEIQNKNSFSTKAAKSWQTESVIWVQSEDKPSTNWVQSEYKPSTNWVQSEDKPSTKKSLNKNIIFSQLQDIILNFIHTECVHNKSKETSALSLKYIANSLGKSYHSIKTTIKRLVAKKVILRVSYKNGRGGSTIYKISDEFYKDYLKNTLSYNNSNNKNYYYKNSEKIEERVEVTTSLRNQLSNDWEEINISPLEHIGLKKTHLEKLSQIENLTPEIVQDSINQFAWGLKNNPKHYEKYDNKIYVLIGALKKGQSWIESSYESEEEKAVKEMIRASKQKQKEKEKLIDELVDLEFSEWKSSLTREKINEISPSNMKLSDEMTDSLLKTHFKIEVIIPRLNPNKNKN